MTPLPEIVRAAWERRDGPAVLATVSNEGLPNIIYITCASLFEGDRFVVADNYFDKTRKNIRDGCKGALLFMDKEGKAFQAKGSFRYHTSGEMFTYMKSFNPPEHPGHAAAVLHVEEVFSGAEKLG